MACRYEFRVKPIKETEKNSQAQKTSGCNKLKSNKIRNISFSFMYVITWQLSVISKSGCGCGFSACDILFVLCLFCVSSQLSCGLKIRKMMKTVPPCLGKFRPVVGQCCHQCTPDSLVSVQSNYGSLSLSKKSWLYMARKGCEYKDPLVAIPIHIVSFSYSLFLYSKLDCAPHSPFVVDVDIQVIYLYLFLSLLRARSLDKTIPLVSTTCWVSMRHKPGSMRIHRIRAKPHKFIWSQRSHSCSFLWIVCRYRGWLVRRMCCALFVSGCKVYGSPVSGRLERVCQSHRYLRRKRGRMTGVEMLEESK